MKVRGLVPLPPYTKFAGMGRVTFSPDTPLMLNNKRIGTLISAVPTADRESLELTVELDDAVEIPPLWIEVARP